MTALAFSGYTPDLWGTTSGEAARAAGLLPSSGTSFPHQEADDDAD